MKVGSSNSIKTKQPEKSIQIIEIRILFSSHYARGENRKVRRQHWKARKGTILVSSHAVVLRYNRCINRGITAFFQATNVPASMWAFACRTSHR